MEIADYNRVQEQAEAEQRVRDMELLSLRAEKLDAFEEHVRRENHVGAALTAADYARMFSVTDPMWSAWTAQAQVYATLATTAYADDPIRVG